jgi:hypothetical protein
MLDFEEGRFQINEMLAARYIVMVARPTGGRLTLAGMLSDFAGIDVLRVDAEHAVVVMDSSTAERLRSRYPFLDVEEDVKHRKASSA